MMGDHDRAERRAARNLLGAGRCDRPLNERVETLEKLMEYVMADLDTLNTTLDEIATDAGEVASEHQTLVDELTALQAQVAANQPIDLTGAIAKATAIKTTLDGIATAASSATTADTGAAPTS